MARKFGSSRANQVLVFCGERRSGKTSILFQILNGRLGERFLPVLVDMQILAGIRDDTLSEPTAEDLDSIVTGIVDNPLPQMIYSWNSLPDSSKVLLAAGRRAR